VETFFPENQLVLILAKAAAGALFSLRLAGGTGDPVLLCAHGATVETEAGGRTAIRAGWSRAFSRHIGPGLDVGIEGSGILQSGSIYKVRAARQAGRGAYSWHALGIAALHASQAPPNRWRVQPADNAK